MLSEADIAHARVTPPPERLDAATIRALVAVRPEERLEERIGAAMYLDGLAAQEAARLPSSVRAGRLMAFAEETDKMLAEAAELDAP
ncbi:hypothetical protein SEA_CEN1621_68 [Microbacterium phage Cen1621]|uniref:Uncharacterized protein n=1 Tax=Microbacterium phage Cen1621 TaxID=2965191 RepID=A0A9E7QAF8_9CAUD|nr:hypothetical protein SEA_CEN1621_68 [Microbacterium phage Cen1621]